MSLAIVWFRRDLRLRDNPALAAALANHAQVLPVYIHAPDEEGTWPAGAASAWWLHHALADLAKLLSARLLLRHGPTTDTLLQLATATGAAAVYWNRLYEPAAIARDTQLKRALRAAGLQASSHNAALLAEPWEVSNKQGEPYRVFTPFWKALGARGLAHGPCAVPSLQRRLLSVQRVAALAPVALDEFGLLPAIRWDEGMAAAWQPTRAAAEARLDEFLADGLRHYRDGRDLPGRDWVSRLSPYLHFGQLGPREVVAAVRGERVGGEDFLRELGWREFAHHLLYHFPHTSEQPMDGRFAVFPWREDKAQLRAWQRGRTGIPLVDAGMRQLWATGWMHNRVRMIVASFLSKNLLLPWHEGARWFWDTLVDADLANNSLGWQWTAGSGADAAPYFRVFNPVLQGERFDAHGTYVRQWVPELAAVPDKWLHKPWQAPKGVLSEAGVVLGTDYPCPVVDLQASRERALAAWGKIKNSR
ncbi:MAG: deoxyribodipyrimidine photo-lyase [Gammaproteobacteria bacterium]|nr:deoxyribodipyrimidine photo-lyase [Gammaproteobacteria bacterium]